MKTRIISMLAVVVMLGACSSGVITLPPAGTYAPYVSQEKEALPDATATTPWIYPEGTPTDEIVQDWRDADLFVGFLRTKEGVATALVGPQFYSLSASSQRGFAAAVSNMYNAPVFSLVDDKTHRKIGTFSARGLYTY